MAKHWDETLIAEVKALAERGATTREVSQQLGLSMSVAYDIIKGLDIEAPWKIRRRLRKQFNDERRAQQLAEKSRPNPKYLEIVRRYEAGETLQQIADTVGRSRERIRQIINESGHSPKALRKASRDQETQRTEELIGAIEAWIECHKGCTPDEIKKQFSLEWDEVSGIIGVRARQLVLDRAEVTQENVGQLKWTYQQIVEALQEASRHRSPLTKTAYDDLVHSGTVKGPSGARIIHIHGAWSAACAIAEVECGEPLRSEYTRKWTTIELVEAVQQFISESESLSVEAYDQWRAQGTGIPSSVLIRVKLGTWTDIRRRALELLRSQWSD
jgi:transposase